MSRNRKSTGMDGDSVSPKSLLRRSNDKINVGKSPLTYGKGKKGFINYAIETPLNYIDQEV